MKHTINNRTERRLEKQAIHEAIYGDLEIKEPIFIRIHTKRNRKQLRLLRGQKWGDVC